MSHALDPALSDDALAAHARKLPDGDLSALVRRGLAAETPKRGRRKVTAPSAEAEQAPKSSKRERRTNQALAEMDAKILATVPPAGQDGISAEEIASRLGEVDTRKVSPRLIKLRSQGKLAMVGVRRGARYNLASVDPAAPTDPAPAVAAE